jgi:transposase
MSNVLKVSVQATIYSLTARGWSRRRIARELGIDRATVGRYLQWANSAISTPGPEGAGEVNPANSTAGNGRGRKSQCEPLADVILAKAELGLSAQRIYQDLVAENAFSDSYQSVKRFVRKLRAREPERVWRLECQPGEEVQLDFGLGAPIQDRPAKGRRSWVLRLVLSYSRKGYSEALIRQDTETFLRCLENALRSFGGAPLLLNLDNFKAAVLKADWFDPEINPKLADFCRHYGMHVVPCRPAMPQHKGKIERGVAYLRTNALKGRCFESLAELNGFLAHWESSVADQRIHGTTRRQVAACFEEERPHLQPLPASLFPCYHEAQRNVHRDSYVEVERAFYEVPSELIGHQVWVRWDSRCVRVLNERLEQAALHTRLEAGKFSHTLGACGLRGPVLSSCRYWVSRAAALGGPCGQWAQGALDRRGPESLRSIMALCSLIKKHSASVLNAACTKALQSGTYRLKDLRRFMGEQPEQTPFGFAQSHPLIRDLTTYADFINPHRQPAHDDQHAQTPCPDAASFRTA